MVLVACEESQEVCVAFRERGHEAYSCDIQPCSGNHPEWHIEGDCLRVINGCCEFFTSDGSRHVLGGRWDLIIAHPPCTYLTVTANRWYDIEKYGDDAKNRYRERYKAIAFFVQIACANCDRIAIENPKGIMSSCYRKSDQTIQPYEFGHPVNKTTQLWLKGLPKLVPTNVVDLDPNDYYSYISKDGHVRYDNRYRSRAGKKKRSKMRSKTFSGIAAAMAEQWGVL